MDYANKVKKILYSDIAKMKLNLKHFVQNPEKDFSRKRKLDFETMLIMTVMFQSDCLTNELLKYFNHELNTPTTSAFCQQYSKLSTSAFTHLLTTFNSHFPIKTYKNKYQLIACDGTEFNIARNPNDPDSFNPPSGCSKKGYNMIHVTSFFDLINKRYLDSVTQPGRKKSEFQAICELIENKNYNKNSIFIVDRGFYCYNFFAHAIENNSLFIVRAKDLNVKRLLNQKELPNFLDTSIEIILTKTQAKKKWFYPERSEQYRYICSNVKFDYINDDNKEYILKLRILRFKIKENVYENIITNLFSSEFLVDEIKELYNMRWGIETSFRDLKHIIGANNFHFKKVRYIEQEILSRMILYNFCSIIAANVLITKKKAKHIYQINFSIAIKICHTFLRKNTEEINIQIGSLISKFILPIRPNRVYDRRHRPQPPVSFSYRHS